MKFTILRKSSTLGDIAHLVIEYVIIKVIIKSIYSYILIIFSPTILSILSSRIVIIALPSLYSLLS
jgi:hypothetical protein